jgi:hypothetical protein
MAQIGNRQSRTNLNRGDAVIISFGPVGLSGLRRPLRFFAERRTTIPAAKAPVIGAGERRGRRVNRIETLLHAESDAPGEIRSLDSARIVDRILGPLTRCGKLRT